MICICKEMAVEWHDHGVMGMIKNEKYKGDVLLGRLLQLTRFQREDLPIWERKINNISGITMKQSYQEKSGIKQKRFD